MYSSKLSITKRFSVFYMKYFVYSSMLCRLNTTFTICSWDILSLTKSLPENFRLLSSRDLWSRFLRLYITEFLCLRHLNLTITLSALFIRWQACKSFGTTFTPVNDKALQMFSPKTSSVISAGTGFSSIVSFLLYWEFLSQHCALVVLFLSVNGS